MHRYNEELLKDLLRNETEDKVQLNSRVNIPTGFIVLIYGIIFYCLTSIQSIENNGIGFAFYIFFGITNVYILKTSHHIYKCHCDNYIYERFPKPSELNQYVQQLEETYEINKDNPQLANICREEFVKKYFNIYLRDTYIKVIEHNRAENDRKNNNLNNVGNSLKFVLVFGFISILLYIFTTKQMIPLDIDINNIRDIDGMFKINILGGE